VTSPSRAERAAALEQPRRSASRCPRRASGRDELAGIVEDTSCTIAPKSLLAQAGLLEAED
jgi:hypothetical protein